MSLVTFRTAVYEHLVAALPDVAVYGALPDDIASWPAVVVGRPSALEGEVATVFDAELDVILLGSALALTGLETELDALADTVAESLGGTRLVDIDGVQVQVTNIDALTYDVAGLEHPAYSVGIVHSYRTPEC